MRRINKIFFREFIFGPWQPDACILQALEHSTLLMFAFLLSRLGERGIIMDSIAQLMSTNRECRFAYSLCAADTMEFLISDTYFGREPMPDAEAIRKTPESAEKKICRRLLHSLSTSIS
jgi:hypothetical protein